MAPPLLLGRLASFFLLLLPLFLLASHIPSAAADEPLYTICPNTGRYTSNGAFQANLNLLLASLLSKAPPTGFSNDTVGRDSDRVHGLALCRGDRTEEQCRGCLASAAGGVVKACPYTKDATIWYETCHLRYSDRSFFGLPTGTQFYMLNVNNVSDPAGFGQLLGGLMDGLTRRAAYGPSLFAAGAVGTTGGGSIYGLVQCTRDLTADACNRCLREEIGTLPTCCNGKQGGRVMGGSCFLRYEVAPFYNASAVAAPSAVSPAQPPAPEGASPPPRRSTPPMSLEPPPPAAEGPSPAASAANVKKALLDLPHLLFFFFLLVAFAGYY